MLDRVLRFGPRLCTLLVCVAATSPVFGDDVVVDVDPAYPSGGSGAPLVLSAGRTVTVDVDLSNPAASPASSIADEPGGRARQRYVL